MSLAACRGAPSPGSVDTDGSAAWIAATAAERDGARPQVELTWRLFETRRWLEGHDKHESAVIELLVNGGEPSRVDLGRRNSVGCVVRDATGPALENDAGGGLDAPLASLDCAFAHARVLRAGTGELRVFAGDSDPAEAANDSALVHSRTASVRVPAGADVAVDPALARIPDEAPSP
jgi:hypothetical protein